MKKLSMLVVTSLFALFLTACGEQPKSTEPATTEQAQPAATDTDATAADKEDAGDAAKANDEKAADSEKPAE